MKVTGQRTFAAALVLILLLLAAFVAGRHSAPARAPRPTEITLPAQFEALCTRVIDGDTIELEGGERVRYIGIDTPEMRPVEAYAEAATEGNRALVEGRTVLLVLDVQERDRYGRLLADVYADGVFVNAELVRRGLAQVMTCPPNVRHEGLLLRLQREAREADRGLWSEDDAQPHEPLFGDSERQSTVFP